jgi:hypothetical protein
MIQCGRIVWPTLLTFKVVQMTTPHHAQRKKTNLRRAPV